MKSLIGYSDRLSVRPGEVICFKISAADTERYSAQLVKLICGGGAHPSCPPFREREISATINGSYLGHPKKITPGSYVTVENVGALDSASDFTLLVTFMPTTPGAGTQHLLCRWDPAKRQGWSLHLTAGARLAFVYGEGEGSTVVGDGVLESGQWYRVIVRAQPSRKALELTCHLCSPNSPFHAPVSIRSQARGCSRIVSLSTPLFMGAAVAGYEVSGSGIPIECFNGRLESPVIYQGCLTDDEAANIFAGERPAEGLLADWDFSRDISGTSIVDRSINALHGRTRNLPLRGVKGSRWDGSLNAWPLCPEAYAAIHFHSDDLYDCGWSTDIAYRVDSALSSGIYALRLRQGGEEEYLPFFVAPLKHHAQTDVVFIVPTYTYVAYGNMRVLGNHEAMCRARTESELTDEAFAATLMTGPGTEHYVRQMDQNPELGLSTYDHHCDGSAVHFSSCLRPLLNLRPKTMLWTFAADLLITDWLEAGGVNFDVITDELLHSEGVGLLLDYRVAITGNHPEYLTSPELDAMRSFLREGGRLMYLGGNGYYWRTAVHNLIPGVIEVRRTRGVTQTCRGEIGEDYLAFTGEMGGIWRDIGRSPQQLVAVGFIAQGSSGSHYRVAAGARESRAAWILEGIQDDVIGNFGCFTGGAAGQEIDQVSTDYGTPPHTVILASSERHEAQMVYVIEEMMGDILKPEHFQSRVRADMAFFETPKGGAVFAVGSMAWCGSLAHDNYQNNVARLTGNVLRRFRDSKDFNDDPWA